MYSGVGTKDIHILVNDIGMVDGRFEIATYLRFIFTSESNSSTKLYYM